LKGRNKDLESAGLLVQIEEESLCIPK